MSPSHWFSSGAEYSPSDVLWEEDILHDRRTGKNTQHSTAALVRQSTFGRLAGYEIINNSERLSLDPTMRFLVGDDSPVREALGSLVRSADLKFEALDSRAARDLRGDTK